MPTESDLPLARFQAEWRPVGRAESAPDLKLRAHSDAKPVSTLDECALALCRVAALAAMAVAGLLGDATATRAQQSQYWAWCENRLHAMPDLQIGGCSAIIQAGKETEQNLAIVFRNRGIAFKSKGNYDRAIEDYSQAIALNPQFADAYLSRGIAYKTMGDYNHAIEDYSHAIELNPGYADAYDARCYVKAILGRLPEALADCTESLRLLPNTYYTLDSRGLIYLKMGRFDEAISDYDAALRVNPRIAESLYGRGLAKLKRGDSDGTADIAAAKAINPDISKMMAGYGVK